MTGLKLASRAQEFEHEALSQLPALRRAALRITGSLQDAEDAVQETYLRAWKYFGSFEAGTNCRAWLFRILFNVLNLEHGRHARMPESPFEDTDEPASEHYTSGHLLDPLRHIERLEVREAIDTLPVELRSLLWIVVIEGFSYQEASVILEIPIGTVMSRLHRAKRELKNVFLRARACVIGGRDR